MNQLVRIGLISYTHNDPLFYFFMERGYDDVKVVRAAPKDLVELLLSGDVDIAQVSLSRLSQHEDLAVVQACAVHSAGPSLSAFVGSNTEEDLKDYDSISISAETETSSRMLKWILKKKGLRNNLRQGSSSSADDLLRESGFALLIGDEALQAEINGIKVVLDIGHEWFRLTGKPAIFAASAVKKPFTKEMGKVIADGIRMIRDAVRYGEENLEKIVTQSSKDRGMQPEYLRRYFKTLLLNYNMELEDGMKYEIAEISDLSERVELKFLDNSLVRE